LPRVPSIAPTVDALWPGGREGASPLGITSSENLPGGGGNLQDMCSCPASCSRYKGKMPDSAGRQQCRRGRGVLVERCSGALTLVLSFINCLPVVTPEVAARLTLLHRTRVTIAPALVQPTSTGSVRLASDDFRDAALIDGNYLGTSHDVAAIVAPSKPRVKSVINTPSTVCARANSSRGQGERRGDRELADWGRRASGTPLVRARWASTHSLLSTRSFACTASWVYGVVDASVMPRLSRARDQTRRTHMVAGRAANADPRLRTVLTIDTHHHMLPDFFWHETGNAHAPVGDLRLLSGPRTPASRSWTTAGIDIAMLSISTPACMSETIAGRDWTTVRKSLQRRATSEPADRLRHARQAWISTASRCRCRRRP